MSERKEVKPLGILVALLIAIIFYLLGFPVSEQAHFVLVIAVFTGTLWFTEALPLHVTAMFSTVLLIIFAGIAPATAFSQYFAPTIVLFFGGFMIARAMQKHGLDRQIAFGFISRIGNDPAVFVLGLMVVTAFLSLWISNTAATAIMLPIGLFAVTKAGLKPLQSGFAKAVVLGIAFAATIGGIGTLVGTPPNGITVAGLAHEGIEVSFLEWMYYGMPFVVLFIPIAWFILMRVYPSEIGKIEIMREKSKWTKEHKLILLVGALTILAWVTSFIHSIADAVVAIGAVILLYVVGLLKTEDVSKIEWSALLLFGGGLALGAAIDSSGLGSYIGSLLVSIVSGQAKFVLFLLVLAFAVVMTLSASNTATAALLVPIVLPLAKMLGVGMKQLAILAGMGTSLDFLVPVGTPPSAIAYSSGYITVWDMFRAGIFITISGILLLAGMAWLYW